MAAQYDSSVNAEGRSLEFKEVRSNPVTMAHADAHCCGDKCDKVGRS